MTDSLPRGLFSLGQGLTRVEGMGLWTRSRVESTFHDDLRRVLLGCVAANEVQQSFVVPGRPKAETYSIDCCVEAPHRLLFLFGVQHTSKARQTIILLRHPQAHEVAFEFMVVCSDIEELPKADRARLMIAANDVTPNIHNTAAIEQTIRHRRVV